MELSDYLAVSVDGNTLKEKLGDPNRRKMDRCTAPTSQTTVALFMTGFSCRIVALLRLSH